MSQSIHICIPTKNRWHLISALLVSLDNLSSGENEISYSVGVEKNDRETIATLFLLKQKIPSINIEYVPDNILTIGAIWNFLSAKADADITMALPDDMVPLCKNWDRKIANYFIGNVYHNHALSWSDEDLGDMCGYPIVSRHWLEKVGYLCAPHFPFWFCDTWLEEVYQFAFNRKLPVVDWLPIGGKRGETFNLRNLDFWWGFFNATRIVRLEEAYRLSQERGLADGIGFDEFMMSRYEWIKISVARDMHFKATIPALEKNRIDLSPPSPKYFKAREAALNFLKEKNLSLWGCTSLLKEAA